MSLPLVVGIDISKRWFDAAAADGRTQRFDNHTGGHRAFIDWLRGPARVVIEATGTYGLDLALALHADASAEVMVANPRIIKGFAQAIAQRSKTDPADAKTILAFAETMPFVSWTPPSEAVRELRAIARRAAVLTDERAREKNRLASLRTSEAHSRLIENDIEVNIRHLNRRIDQLISQAVELIRAHQDLSRAYDHLTSIKGVAAKSAVAILGELLVLPPDMTARQWVAHAGLDPREYASGTSVQRRVRISKMGSVHLRRALYMPAMVASRCEPRVKAYYADLIANEKKPLVAYVAVMRKLLHAIHGMLREGTDFDGERFRATPQNVLAGT